MLVFNPVVPASASGLIVASDIQSVGLSAHTPETPYTVPVIPGGLTIPWTGENRQRKYVFSTYGPVTINAYGAPLNPSIPQRRAS